MSGGEPGRRAGRATAARRDVSHSEMRALTREQLRALCQLLIMESGAAVVAFNPMASYDEWHVLVVPFWRERRIRIQLHYDELNEADVRRATELVVADHDVECVLVAVGSHH